MSANGCPKLSVRPSFCSLHQPRAAVALLNPSQHVRWHLFRGICFCLLMCCHNPPRGFMANRRPLGCSVSQAFEPSAHLRFPRPDLSIFWFWHTAGWITCCRFKAFVQISMSNSISDATALTREKENTPPDKLLSPAAGFVWPHAV